MPRVRSPAIEPQLVVITGNEGCVLQVKPNKHACLNVRDAGRTTRPSKRPIKYSIYNLNRESRFLPNLQQFCGRTRLRGHAAFSLNTTSPANCQVCCTKVSRIVTLDSPTVSGSGSENVSYNASARTFYPTIGSMLQKKRAGVLYGTRCVGLLCHGSRLVSPP